MRAVARTTQAILNRILTANPIAILAASATSVAIITTAVLAVAL